MNSRDVVGGPEVSLEEALAQYHRARDERAATETASERLRWYWNDLVESAKAGEERAKRVLHQMLGI